MLACGIRKPEYLALGEYEAGEEVNTWSFRKDGASKGERVGVAEFSNRKISVTGSEHMVLPQGSLRAFVFKRPNEWTASVRRGS